MSRCPWSGYQCTCKRFPWKGGSGAIPERCLTNIQANEKGDGLDIPAFLRRNPQAPKKPDKRTKPLADILAQERRKEAAEVTKTQAIYEQRRQEAKAKQEQRKDPGLIRIGGRLVSADRQDWERRRAPRKKRKNKR